MRTTFFAVLAPIFLVHSLSISQVKYTDSNEKTSSLTAGVSSSTHITDFEMQFGFSRKGRIAGGIMAEIDDDKNTTKGLGVYLEGALIKPEEQNIVGLDLLFSFSKLWHHIVFEDQDIAGYGIDVGGETYIKFPDHNFVPFLQLIRSYVKLSEGTVSASTVVYSAGLGCDFFLDDKLHPTVIGTPEILFTDHGQTIFNLNFSVVLKRNAVKQIGK